MKTFFFQKAKFCLILFSMLILAGACKNDSKSTEKAAVDNKTNDNTATEKSPATDDSKTSTKPSEYATVVPLKTKDLVYAWVDKLNIRDTPSLKGKTITTVQSNDALEFTGDKSKNTEEIVLRGVAYDDAWLKVVTPDKKEGWVYGGAVKRKEEQRGNSPITDTQFDFPHFGKYDLSSWKKLGTKEEGEEVDYIITTYQKGNRILEVTKSDMGEFYYGYTYKLMDDKKNILKVRNFDFSADVDTRTLTEKVEDFSSTPTKVFTRTQKLKTHFYSLNARPLMLRGNWSETNLTQAKGDSTATTNAATSGEKFRLQSFEFGACTKLLEKEFDCSCSFSTGDTYKGPTIFLWDWDKSACVNVDGQMNALYPDWEERDYKAELKKLADSKNWINVADSGITYFGKSLEDYKYVNGIDLLIDVILASGKDITTIPIQNTSTRGMAIREVRDEAAYAIKHSKMYRSKGGKDPLTIVKYDNRSYDVFVRYRQLTQYEGEANKYEGTITLLKNRDSKILETREIKGTCGC